MTAPHDLLKIGDFARLAKTNLRTLRYYEEMGLLLPAARSTGGFRYYRPSDINRVRLIWDLQELGLHLDRIAELLNKSSTNSDRESLHKRVSLALEEHDRLLEERILQLQNQRQNLVAARKKLVECHGCPHHPSEENNYCQPCLSTDEALPNLLSALF